MRVHFKFCKWPHFHKKCYCIIIVCRNNNNNNYIYFLTTYTNYSIPIQLGNRILLSILQSFCYLGAVPILTIKTIKCIKIFTVLLSNWGNRILLSILQSWILSRGNYQITIALWRVTLSANKQMSCRTTLKRLIR